METKFDKIRIRKITKWIIGVVTACILIYLAKRPLAIILSLVLVLGNL